MKTTFLYHLRYWKVAVSLALLKLFIHLLTNTNYGFHRDEFLYLAMGDYLRFGYLEVPPFIALAAKFAFVFGGDIFVVRLLPAIAGSITVFVTAVMVHDLGGKNQAQWIACLAFILSPATMRINTLFQPVSFNLLWWSLSMLFVIKLIRYKNNKYWYYMGVTAGIGILTKYSILFFFTAFLLAVVITKYRIWLKSRFPYIAAGLALIITLPNLIWQFQHNWPVMVHMSELYQKQLIHVQTWEFLKAQFIMFHAGSFIWLSGLIYLFFSSRLSDYRILGWTFMLVVLLLMVLSGKSYYSIGAYPVLFALGGIAFERLFENFKIKNAKGWFTAIIIVLSIPVIPFGLPVLPLDKLQTYCAYVQNSYSYKRPLLWEDGEIHSIPQDYADMHGWEAVAEKTSCFYHNLSETEKDNCILFSFDWGYAGALYYYREKYHLPEIYNLYSSFLLWLPDSINFKSLILVDEFEYNAPALFKEIRLEDSIRSPYYRFKANIYYCTQPKNDYMMQWSRMIEERKNKFVLNDSLED